MRHVHPYFEHDEYNNSIATAQIIGYMSSILSLLQLQKGDMYCIVFYHGEDSMILVHPYFEHDEYNNSIATAQIIGYMTIDYHYSNYKKVICIV